MMLSDLRAERQARVGARKADQAKADSSAELPYWRWESYRVRARTKSEARATLKAMLGKERLPAGVNIVREMATPGKDAAPPW